MKVNTGSANVHALNEALKSPEVSNQLKDTKFAREGLMLDKCVYFKDYFINSNNIF